LRLLLAALCALALIGVLPNWVELAWAQGYYVQDTDGDGHPDSSDNCPLVANPGQQDSDGNQVGNACEPDIDGDGVLREADNCPVVANPGQHDRDSNGVGDRCDFEWVTVGNPGNAPDAPSMDGQFLNNYQYPTGGVDYIYQIAKYETTNTQYAEFLNAVAGEADPYRLYPPETGASFAGPGAAAQDEPESGIVRSGEAGSYTYEVTPGMENKPVFRVTFLNAVRFANWLHNGKPTGPDPGYVPALDNFPNFFRDKWKDAGLAGCRRVVGGYSGIIPTGGSGTGMVLSMEFATSGGSSDPIFRPLVRVDVDNPGSGYQVGDVLTIAVGSICNQGFPVSINTEASITLEASDFRTAEDTFMENGAYATGFTFVKDRLQANAGDRNPGATYFITNEDEWYKAAYHDSLRPSVETFVQSQTTDGVPVSADLGDFWWNTDENPASLYQAAGPGVNSIGAGDWESGRYINPLQPNSTLYPPSPAVPPMFTDRRDPGGTVISSFNAGLRSDTMATVGTAAPFEVWIGQQSDFGPVNRFDANGNLLGSFDAGISVDAMTFAGNEVWIGEAVAPGLVRRFDLTGNFIAEFNLGITVDRSIAMTYTGSEVWVGQSVSGGPIRRFDLTGNLLGQFNSGFAVKSLAFTGTEVVVGWDNPLGPIRIFDLAGNQTGSFNAVIKPNALTFANGEIWVGKVAAPGTLKTFDLAGTETSTVDTGLKLTALTSVGTEVWMPGARSDVREYDIWFDATDRNRAYRAQRVDASRIGPGEWEPADDVPTQHYWRYPTGTNSQPACGLPGSEPNTANCYHALGDVAEVGSYRASPSPSGTFDQGGNVWEWVDRNGAYIQCPTRTLRGGDFSRFPEFMASSLPVENCVHSTYSQYPYAGAGFRIARIPGPDADNDGVEDSGDNCPTISNPDQADPDADDIGSACDNCPGVHNPL